MRFQPMPGCITSGFRAIRPKPFTLEQAMLFGRDPRKKAVLELAMKQVEKVLKDMVDDGKNLENLKFKKYQKTHYTNCICSKCLKAKRNKNPHQRGLLEDGYKVYVDVGDEEHNE